MSKLGETVKIRRGYIFSMRHSRMGGVYCTLFEEEMQTWVDDVYLPPNIFLKFCRIKGLSDVQELWEKKEKLKWMWNKHIHFRDGEFFGTWRQEEFANFPWHILEIEKLPLIEQTED